MDRVIPRARHSVAASTIPKFETKIFEAYDESQKRRVKESEDTEIKDKYFNNLVVKQDRKKKGMCILLVFKFKLESKIG